ncbi:MAG TPA: methyltransferase domain-containing protein [Pirellulaceae bacterium]|nr:methyltransferase domain-containing protein [Pirellulaceae bacterium]
MRTIPSVRAALVPASSLARAVAPIVATLVACLALLTTSLPLAAQEKSVKPGINKTFEDPNVENFVGTFEKEGRDVFDRRKEVLDALNLKPGQAVADIGAGTGLFSRMMAGRVGAQGKVYAVDIAAKFVRHVEATAKKEGLENIVGVVCKADSSELPANSVDVVFICDAYHHFEFPIKTMKSIHSALKPGGHVVLIDFKRIEGQSRDWVINHVRAGQDVFSKEIMSVGFKQVDEKQDLLRESYFVRFEKTAAPAEESAKSDGKSDAKPETKPDAKPDAKKSSGVKREANGVFVHDVSSPRQAGPTQIRVLVPDKLAANVTARTLYVLPVEAGRESRYGDGLSEVQRHDLHNRFGMICVAPTFAHLPWYADHSTRADLRQEDYLLKDVLPLVEANYPASPAAADRWLLGFSKSGWGAVSLLMRHPQVFGRAAAWDAPLMKERPDQFGMGEIFGTQENFAKYQLTTLAREAAAKLGSSQRIVLTAYDNFRDHHVQFHKLLDEHKVPHVYRDGPRRKHVWESGWVPEAVELLAGLVQTGAPDQISRG